MDTMPTAGRGERSANIGPDEAARKLADTRARCAEARAHAEEVLERAQDALAAAKDRLQQASAVLEAVRATREHAVRAGSQRG
jgi:hypothetical protein